MDVAGVRLLLAQKVVDPGLDVGAEAGGGQPLGGEPVLLPLRARRLVTARTFEPENGETLSMGVSYLKIIQELNHEYKFQHKVKKSLTCQF